MESSGNLVILLQARAASEDFWQPELTDRTLHMADLALGRLWCLDPLRRFPSDTAYHVGVGQGLWGPLLGLDIQS